MNGSSEEVEMGRVIVGVDPHKKSVTIEAVDEHGTVLATGRFATDSNGLG
jgi:transposase